MFSHIMIGAKDVEDSRKFYDAVLGALGYQPSVMDPKGRCFWVTEAGVHGPLFAITKPIDGAPATYANGGTIGFGASSKEAVDAWHAVGLANGGTACEDPPGTRHNGLYVAYLRDPAGHKVCARHP